MLRNVSLIFPQPRLLPSAFRLPCPPLYFPTFPYSLRLAQLH